MSAASTPFTQYSKLVTARLRARVHAQSFSNAVMERKRRSLSPAAKATIARVDALVALKLEHRRCFDPTLKAKAVQQLQALRLLSADEDPHFVCTIRALRVAAYFEAVHSPATLALLNHLTKHTFLLDGFNVHQLATILLELRHPRSGEVLTIVLPRIREVLANDVTAVECCAILEALYTFDVGQQDELLAERCALVMRRTIADLTLADVGRCVAALPYLPSRLHAREVLAAAEGRLRELLEEAVLIRRVYTEEVFLHRGGSNAVGAAVDSLESVDTTLSSSSDTRAAAGTVDNLGEQSAAQKAVRENRAVLLASMRGSVALMRGLLRTGTWLGWAPRGVWKELVRAVVAYSDPRPERATGLNSSVVGDSEPSPSAAVLTSTTVMFEEEERELAELWLMLPSMERRDMAQLLRLLSAANCRHERSLRVLAARIVAHTGAAGWERGEVVSDDTMAGAATHGRRLPTEIHTLTDLTTAAEALAFFYMFDTTATVSAIVDEVVRTREESSAAFRSPQQMLILVDIISRLLLSLTRLRYPSPAAEATEQGTLRRLLQDDAIAWFAGGPTCARQPLLAAQLAAGMSRVEAALLQCSTATAAAAGVPQPTPQTVRQLAQLLEGVSQCGPDKLLTAAASGTGPAGKAEAQLALSEAATAAKALNSTDVRLTRALAAVEALSLKLL